MPKGHAEHSWLLHILLQPAINFFLCSLLTALDHSQQLYSPRVPPPSPADPFPSVPRCHIQPPLPRWPSLPNLDLLLGPGAYLHCQMHRAQPAQLCNQQCSCTATNLPVRMWQTTSWQLLIIYCIRNSPLTLASLSTPEPCQGHKSFWPCREVNKMSGN